jgi:hypothetical protein
MLALSLMIAIGAMPRREPPPLKSELNPQGVPPTIAGELEKEYQRAKPLPKDGKCPKISVALNDECHPLNVCSSQQGIKRLVCDSVLDCAPCVMGKPIKAFQKCLSARLEIPKNRQNDDQVVIKEERQRLLVAAYRNAMWLIRHLESFPDKYVGDERIVKNVQ